MCRSGDRDGCRSRADRGHGEGVRGDVDRYGSNLFVARRRTVGEILPAELVTKRDHVCGIFIERRNVRNLHRVRCRWLGHGDGKGLFGLALRVLGGDRDGCRSRTDRGHGEGVLLVVDRYGGHGAVARGGAVLEVRPVELIGKRNRADLLSLLKRYVLDRLRFRL